MKKLKSIKAYIISLFFLSLFGVFTFAYADSNLAPVNPDFESYLLNLQKVKAQKQTQKGRALGLIPSPVDLSHMKGQKISRKVKGVAPLLGYSASYDLRSEGKLTPVKNQGPDGTCWAFATYSSLESCLLPIETRDFSENNILNLHGFDPGYADGGNYTMSTAYLARWGGPVNEADDPYSNPGGSAQGLPVQKHIQEVLFIPDRGSSTDNDNIKEMVTTYGAVMTSMYMNEATYYNSANHAYYYNGSNTTNHGVAIVGWDDNYNKSNFSAIPPGNGAFIVKNSWGTSWGDNGYFYISYYDSKIGTKNTVFDVAESTGNYDKIYQYDPLGVTGHTGYSSDTAWFANIFTATSNNQLKAVGFYTSSLNSSYEIYVYESFNGTSFSGLLGSKTGTIPISGYHTIELDSPIPILLNYDFCIVVKLTTPGYNFPIPIEHPLADYSSLATASAGQSYIGSNGTSWTDSTATTGGTPHPNRNVCLKAYTLNSPVITSITPNSGENTGQVSITNLAGTGFVTGAAVKLSKSGQNDINATGITVVSTTKMTCAFDLNGKAPGTWDVVVSAGSESSTLANGFLVVSSITVNSITPNSAPNTGQVSITNIAGAGFRTGGSVKLSKSGQSNIDATGVTVVSPTKITCAFDLNGKAPGYWDVVVSTGGAGSISTTLANSFIVVSSITVSSITPDSAGNIGQVSITNLIGAGFRTGASVKLSKSGQSDINATGVTIVSPTKITCAFDLNEKALGRWDVVVSTGGAGSISATLTNGLVVVSSVIVTSITPNSRPNTGLVWISSLTGAGFMAGASVKLTKSGESEINALSGTVDVNSFTKMTCTFDVNGAAPGSWNVVVSTGGAGSVSATLPNAFLLISSITISSITENTAPNIKQVAPLISGSGFRSGVSARLTRPGQSDIIGSSVTVETGSYFVCFFDLNGKTPGYWDVVVTTGGAGSLSATLSNGFLVVSSITVSSITPDSAYNSRSVSIKSLTGAGFRTGVSAKLVKSGQNDINAADVTVVSSSKITCTFGLAGKATGYWDVVASTGGAGSLSATLGNGFLVISSVTVNSITPNSAPNTGQVSITNLAGKSFVSGASVKLIKSGENDIDAEGITLVSPTKITCVFDLNGKAPGRWDVVASTGGAGAESGTFANGFLVISSITVTSITPDTAFNNSSVSITNLAGAGFRAGAAVKLVKSGQNDINATDVAVVSSSKITCTFGLLDKATGYWDVVVSTGGTGSISAALKKRFLVQVANITTTRQLNDSSNSTVVLQPAFGEVKVDIPAGSFGQNVAFTVSTAAVSASGQPVLKVTDIAIEITNDKGLQPLKEIIITLLYRDSDIAELDESKLTVAYYDATHNWWVTIPSTVYPDQNKITASVKHLTKFALVQLTPAADLAAIKGYPIPYKPNKGLFTFDNLPASADIKIFTVAGQLVRKVEYVNATGRASWDGKNDGGSVVASGVYVVLIKNNLGKKVIKIAVEK
ncbi:MAG: lectin like domain-containing protein [Elusimicrobia bacterium]|nr:lectin like domain-containing protein [Candidatus Liberimonas magnetica]